MRGLLLRKCVFESTTLAPRGYISAFLVDRPENQFFYNCEYLKEYLGVTNNQEFLSGVWVFFQARTIWEPPLWERRAIYGLIGECRVKSEMANYVNFARRMRLPALLFQLGDHIPTMASYQTSIISLGVQPPPMTLSWANTSLELRLSDCLRKLASQWGQCGY